MKKVTAVFVCVFALLAALSGCAAAGELVASESMKAFVAATESFFDSIRMSAPWGEFGEDDAIPLDPVAQLWRI